jgi:hypothetical protein
MNISRRKFLQGSMSAMLATTIPGGFLQSNLKEEMPSNKFYQEFLFPHHTLVIGHYMQARNTYSCIRSGVCKDKDLDNGSMVELSSMENVDNYCEIFNVNIYKNSLKNIWMIFEESPYIYFTKPVKLSKKYNKAGSIFSMYKIFHNDVISVSTENIIGKKEKYLTIEKDCEHLFWTNKYYDDRLMFKHINSYQASIYEHNDKISMEKILVINN